MSVTQLSDLALSHAYLARRTYPRHTSWKITVPVPPGTPRHPRPTTGYNPPSHPSIPAGAVLNQKFDLALINPDHPHLPKIFGSLSLRASQSNLQGFLPLYNTGFFSFTLICISAVGRPASTRHGIPLPMKIERPPSSQPSHEQPRIR